MRRLRTVAAFLALTTCASTLPAAGQTSANITVRPPSAAPAATPAPPAQLALPSPVPAPGTYAFPVAGPLDVLDEEVAGLSEDLDAAIACALGRDRAWLWSPSPWL